MAFTWAMWCEASPLDGVLFLTAATGLLGLATIAGNPRLPRARPVRYMCWVAGLLRVCLNLVSFCSLRATGGPERRGVAVRCCLDWQAPQRRPA